MQRPLSPHLQIYKPQLTSVLSIMHRFTGVILSLGIPMLSLWLLSLSLGQAAYGCFESFLTSWFGRLLLFGWTFSFFYHLSNGVRHLVWDFGKGYSLKSTYRSGWIVLCISTILTALTAYIVLLGDL